MLLDSTEVARIYYWERERRLLNRSLSFIDASLTRRLVFRGGYSLSASVVSSPYTLSLLLNPLGVRVSHRSIFPQNELCFLPVSGVQVCFANEGKFDLDFISSGSYEVEEEEISSLGKEVEAFSLFYNYYVANGRLVARFGSPRTLIRGFSSGLVSFFYEHSGRDSAVFIPWLASIGGRVYCLFSKPLSEAKR